MKRTPKPNFVDEIDTDFTQIFIEPGLVEINFVDGTTLRCFTKQRFSTIINMEVPIEKV